MDPTERCERCGVRPAQAVVRLVRPGRPPTRRRLCDMCLAEGQLMASRGPRGGSFDRFLADWYAARGPEPEGAGRPVGPGGPAGGGAGMPGGPGGRGPGGTGPGDITRYFSDATRRLLQAAAHRAAETGALDLDTDDLLWAIARDDSCARLLGAVDVDADGIVAHLEEAEPEGGPTDVAPSLTPDVKGVLLAAFRESRELGAEYIGPEHLLLGMVTDADTAGGAVLRRFGVTHPALRGAVIRGARAGEDRPSTTPTLDRYAEDLTQRAREGRLDPVIGRDDEIEQAIEILSRRTKNNPVLIGDPGVGKTAVVEGIAQRIAAGEVAESLSGRRLVALDLAGMLAGTKMRGEFEERLKTVIDEITAAEGDLLVFIDELHTIVGAGAAQGAMDAGNMLKPALARGDLHVVGATTLDEYRTSVEKDPALERRFQPVLVREPTTEQAVQILDGLKDRYEAFHRVRIEDRAISAAVELSDRYVADRFLPDKAIDLIDQASARVRLRAGGGATDRAVLQAEVDEAERDKHQAIAAEDYERAAELRQHLEELRERLAAVDDDAPAVRCVTAEDVAEVVSRRTGIPLAQLTMEDRERLLGLEDHLHGRVVGQDEAVDAVAEAVRRSRAGLSDPDRPVGSFLFLGPTGVGKTELARALAEALFGDEDAVLRVDMSEYQERHTVSRLVGAPPGYVGYEEAGQLTEQVRRRPYSVLLLDEIEKAHPDVFNVLLQLLDDGRLTDGQGRTVDFRNTIAIMTSNLGAERIQGHRGPIVGFAPAEPPGGDEAFARLRDDLMEVLRGHFRPEFLNRIDEIVVFRSLDAEQLQRITGLLLDRVSDRLRGRGIALDVTQDAVRWLADRGHDPDFGARPLRRAIQRELENELSRLVLADQLSEGDLVVVSAGDGGLSFEVREGENPDDPLDAWREREPESEPVAAGPSAPRE